MTAGISNTKKIKHVPKRTCIACRNAFEKKDLIRLASGENGTVEPDISGKMTGRGAYLCRNVECWIEGCKGNKLERALKTSISKANRDRLLEWITDQLKDRDDI